MQAVIIENPEGIYKGYRVHEADPKKSPHQEYAEFLFIAHNRLLANALLGEGVKAKHIKFGENGFDPVLLYYNPQVYSYMQERKRHKQ